MNFDAPTSTADYIRKAFEDIMREQGDLARKVYTEAEVREATAKAFEKAKFQRTLVENALLNKTGQNPLTLAKPELLTKPSPMMTSSAKIATSRVNVPVPLAAKAMPMLNQALKFLSSPAFAGVQMLLYSPSAGQGSDVIRDVQTGAKLNKVPPGSKFEHRTINRPTKQNL